MIDMQDDGYDEFRQQVREIVADATNTDVARKSLILRFPHIRPRCLVAVATKGEDFFEVTIRTPDQQRVIDIHCDRAKSRSVA